jgi:hypothetical protein
LFNNTQDTSVVPDSALYDISLSKIEKYILQFHGNKTKEIVLEEYIPQSPFTGENYIIRHTSNVTEHKPHTFYKPTESCPNPELPDWAYEFFKENRKDTTKLISRHLNVFMRRSYNNILTTMPDIFNF